MCGLLALPHDLVPNQTQDDVYRWGCQSVRGCSRSQKFTACMFARNGSFLCLTQPVRASQSSRADTKRCPWCHVGNTPICVSCRTRPVETTTREPSATKSRWFRFCFSQHDVGKQFLEGLCQVLVVVYVHCGRQDFRHQLCRLL